MKNYIKLTKHDKIIQYNKIFCTFSGKIVLYKYLKLRKCNYRT